MIFVLHYILFSSGLSFVIILTALFLQTYSEASMSEIGALLMALPFISIFARPFFCALADRHQAHQFYLVGACFTMALGYGSLAIAPFYPEFIQNHGRLVWYLDMLGIIVGYSAFSVIFSLGDALALNAARKRGISWSLYRVWSTLSWGVFGYIIGLFNETPSLPKYVPGIFMLICSMIVEIILVSFWDKSKFDMADQAEQGSSSSSSSSSPPLEHDEANADERSKAPDEGASRFNTLDRKLAAKLDGTNRDADADFALSSPFSTISAGNARLVGALAGMVVEDIGSSLKSSLKMGKQGQPKRAGLSEMLEQHGAELARSGSRCSIALMRQINAAKNSDASSVESAGKILLGGDAMLAQSLGPAGGRRMNNLERSTLKQAAEQNFWPGKPAKIDLAAATAKEEEAAAAATYGDDLQMLLLKFIVKRDRIIVKSLISFTCFGFLMSVHASYFFLHVERVCRHGGYDFSRLMGALVAAQSASEIFSFIAMTRYYMPLVGQRGSLISCALLFGARFLYYGTYFADYSPYFALVTETFYGLGYGMIYSLVCDCASDCVEQVGQYLPELRARGLIDPSINELQLKLPLRATMQGVFSGAFDGLGYGLGALFGGLFLDIFEDYNKLWQASAAISALTIFYILLTHTSSPALKPPTNTATETQKATAA